MLSDSCEMVEPRIEDSTRSSSWSQLNPNSSQDLTTASTAEVRFVLDNDRRDVLRSTWDEPSELHKIANKYYCDILMEDSTLVIKWTARMLPPKSLIESVTRKVESFIRDIMERDKVTPQNFSATVVYPEIRYEGYPSLFARCKYSKIEKHDNGWQLAEVSGTLAEVNESRKCICEIVTQYTNEKLIVNADQYNFLDVALQRSYSFRMTLLAGTITVRVRMESCRYICLNGRLDEVKIVAERIYSVVSNLVNDVLPCPTFLIPWLTKNHNLDHLQQLLLQPDFAAVLQVKDRFLYAFSDKRSSLEAAVGILNSELTCQPLEVLLDESRDLLTSDHHKPELSRILHSNAELVVEGQVLHLVCWQRDVREITENLEKFFKKNTPVKVKVKCTEAHIAFIRRYLEADFKAIEELADKSNAMKLIITSDSDGFVLVGNTEIVDCGKEKLSRLIEMIETGLCTVATVPNAQEVLKGHVSVIEKRTGTIIRLLDPELDTMARYPSLSEHAEGTWSSQEHSESEVAGSNANSSEDIVILPTWLELCDVKADVLVNSIDWSLDVNRGRISGSLSKRAGPSLQDELYRKCPKGLEFFHYVITESHNVGCRAIIHVVCAPHCGKYTEDRLLSLFLDCLNEVEKNRAASVAFPAIGTGNLHYPPKTVFKLLHDAVAIFRKDRKTTSLEKVYCSLMDPKHRELFAECSKESLNCGIQKKSSSKAKEPESSVLCITTKKPVVQILKNIPSRKLHMVIKFDCSDKPRKGSAPTGNRHGSVHINEDVDLSKLPAALESALRSSESYKATSLSIVAHKNDKMTARCISEVLRKFWEQDGGTITDIALIVTDDQLDTYCQSLLATWYQPDYPLNKASIGDRLNRMPFFGRLFSYFTSQSPRSSDANDDALDIAIYGTSLKQIQEAEVQLKTVLSQECVERDLTCDPEDVSILQDKQINALCALGKIFNTRISVHLEQRKIFIRGYNKEEVYRTREEVKDFISSARQEFFQSEIRRQRLERAKLQIELVQWQYQDDSGAWTNFDEIASMLVEDSHVKKTACSLQTTIGDLEYDPVTSSTVAFIADGSRRKACHVRRIDVKAWRIFPKEWIYDENYLEYVLPKDTDEYNTIESEFLNDAGASANEVLEIKRIQDPHAWNMFKIQEDKAKRSMIDRFEPCTRRLWHGTSPEAVSAILSDRCFNRSFASDEGLYGKGVYFARDASYAAQPQYARASGGIRIVILAEVVTGCFTKGAQLMKVPPKRLGSDGSLYDSTVDDENDPSIFVIYHDSRAYPLYVLKYR